MSKTLLRSIAVTSLMIAAATTPNDALATSIGVSYNPVIIVDSASTTQTLNVGASEIISDINVFIDMTACDNPIDFTGACLGIENSFSRELQAILTSPTGTIVNLVLQDTYFPNAAGPMPGSRIEVLFDDDATTMVGGNNFVTGTFSPVGSLAAFNGEDALGDWSLFFEDTVGGDPKSLNAWRLDINTTAVPAPAPIFLIVLGLLATGFHTRRRSIG